MASLLLTALAACDAVPQRFDALPVPMGSAVLVAPGLHDQPGPWSCVDAAHDAYLHEWAVVMAGDAAALGERIRALNNPLEGGRSPGAEGNWMGELATVQAFARRHASTLRRLESLDAELLATWSTCLGPAWSDRLESLRIDRAIDRWRAVAEAQGPAILDLRLMIPRVAVDATEEAVVREALRDYARRLEPLVRRLAEARLRAPLDGIRIRRDMQAAGTPIEERKVLEAVRAGLRPPLDAILRLDLEVLDQLKSALSPELESRLREALVDAASRNAARVGSELLAPVAAELPSIDARTRRAIREAIAEHEAADQRLRDQLVELMKRDPRSPEVDKVRKARQVALQALNERVIQALPESMRQATAAMRKQGVASLRETLETILDPAVAARFDRELPPPPPAPPPRRLPVRTGSDVLGQLLPSEFGAWATIRLPSLAAGDPDRETIIAALAQEAGERWAVELRGSLDRLRPMQQAVEEGLRTDVSLAELQRRLRTAIAELDAARSRLQLIEDPLLAEAAALSGRAMGDPAVERLRLERATDFAGLGWRDMPVHTLFRLDREATIDVPALLEDLDLDEDSRAIADMALVDSAVPLIEGAESLRQACLQALRGLVLDLKRVQLQKVPDSEAGTHLARAVRSAASLVTVAASSRIELQRELMDRIGQALPPEQTRELRRGYWQRAYPEIFLERRPFEPTAERLLRGLRDGGALEAAAEGVLEARDAALDELLPRMVEARKAWPTDPLNPGPATLATLDREAPVLGTLLRLREEIDSRALRSLASLHGDDETAWDWLATWASERPGAFDGL
jgi:hypothetical protein